MNARQIDSKAIGALERAIGELHSAWNDAPMGSPEDCAIKVALDAAKSAKAHLEFLQKSEDE